MNTRMIFIISLFVIGIVVGILLITKVIKVGGSKSNNNSTSNTTSNTNSTSNSIVSEPLTLSINNEKIENIPDTDNYITPAPFKVGMITEERHFNANDCSDKKGVGYSIQQPFVKYGLPNKPDNCACTEFIQAP